MDGRGGCCIARYGTGGGGGYIAYDMSKVDRIMLRFRPIAPKPASGGSGSTVDSGGSSGLGSDACTKSGRRKRKYSKENGVSATSKRCNRRKRSETKRDGGCRVGEAVMTLPLMPETPDRRGVTDPMEKKSQGPFWLSFGGGGAADAAMVTPRRVTASLVTVERVTDTWLEDYTLGRTDGERRKNLERDTCPGFISDGAGRVTWTNGEYMKMVNGYNNPMGRGVPENNRNHNDNDNMVVWLVMKERPMITYPAFTCRVRLQYTCNDREGSSITLPCDVWRMDGGGFAWRLDVKAALCLGR